MKTYFEDPKLQFVFLQANDVLCTSDDEQETEDEIPDDT